MPLHLVTPFDRTDAPEDEQPLFPPVPTWRSRIADGCYIVLRGSLFLGSSYLMALGLPLLFFLLLSGGNPDAFFAHVANLGDRFLAADFKLTSRLGEPLALGPTGRVPKSCYFVTSEHKDGFDSRYAAIGWICGPRILGVGRPIL